MARLSWNDTGTRIYEAGVDRGVLYLPNEIGVPWSGLVSVSENASGGEPNPVYYDGIKISNFTTSEEFEGTLEAFTAPPEFYACEGMVAVQNGLFITQQRRMPFGLTYRTLLGSDTLGSDAGYKVHLVYNALATSSGRTHQTLSGDNEPTTFSWDISTTPPLLGGFRPTAHFVVDSRFATPELLSSLEDLLYGSEVVDPYLPSPEELYDLFTA